MGDFNTNLLKSKTFTATATPAVDVQSFSMLPVVDKPKRV